jgi:ZIP family zinc transporter
MTVSGPGALGFALIPAIALIVGGVIAAFHPPAPWLRSLLQHFAAGVVFAAVAGELLPREMDEHRPVPFVLGFAAGIALMLAIRELTARSESRAGTSGSGGATSLVLTVGVDLLIDGLLVGIGFAAGAETGILITFALTLEVLSLGLATVATMMQDGEARRQAILTTIGLAVVLLLGAGLGGLLLSGLEGAPYLAMLGFGSAALLYLVTEELLVEAHEVPETALATATFFAGFLVLFVIEMVV